MSELDRPSIIEQPSESFSEALEKALARVKRTTGLIITRGALGAALVSAPMTACTSELGDADVAALEAELLNSSVLDWAQQRGERNPSMVRFEGTSWVELENCSRFCSTANIFLRLIVTPVAGVDLSQKQVGVMYRSTTSTEPPHGFANFVRTLDDGTEEWQAVVPLRGWDPRVISFNAYYETGEFFYDEYANEWRKRTFFDDNGGDLHVVAPGPSTWAIRRDFSRDDIQVGPQGVQGTITARVANFDYEKEVEIVWTTDNWATTNVFGMGEPGQTNAWYFQEIIPSDPSVAHDFERWAININLPGPADHFEYAILYRHGLGDGARRYEFWDNNYFRNYRVEAPILE